MFNTPPPENRALYEIMSANMLEPESPQVIRVRRVHYACWISKATRSPTRTQKWFRERSSKLQVRTLPTFFSLSETKRGNAQQILFYISCET